MVSTSTRSLVLAALLALLPLGAGAVTAVPPAEYRPAAVAAKASATLVGSSARALRIPLAEPASAAVAMAQRQDASARALAMATTKQRPHVIGFPREVPAAARVVPLAGLDWQEGAGGRRVARIELASPGAAGVRLALALTGARDDVTLRLAGNAPGTSVHGPIAGGAVVDATERFGDFVTPVLEGDTAIVELSVATGAPLGGAALVLGTASHLVVAGAALRGVAGKVVSDIGTAGRCNIDVACVQSSPALQEAAKSVGKVVFSDRWGYSYACSGTLLNDSIRSFTPYVLTAAHCMETAYEAASTSVYWFFTAQACGSVQVPPYVLQDGGAMLLARSDDWDWALLRLHRMPPAGIFYSAWRAEPIPSLAVGSGLHHPQGDLTKFSQGETTGYAFYPDGSSFARIQWSQGTTEVGSSGSGLFTFLSDGGYYELRGGLFGGDASCSNRAGNDYYSRLENMLPVVREFLTPDASGATDPFAVVEFHHRGLDHYFMTADAIEIAALDSGAIAGWERTGVRFLAYRSAGAGASPVCRYYLIPAVGNSHFYSADPAECARVGTEFGSTWVYESAEVFHIPLPHPVTGACPAGTRPLWRFFNAGTTNHRYTPEVTLRDAMRIDPAWTAEGYGPDKVIMCSPTQ